MNELWSTIGKAVSKIAPILGNAIVPGLGGIAGSLISEVLNVVNEPEAIEKALQTITPEQAAKLKEVEIANRAKLIDISAELDKAYLLDRQSARSREIEITRATGKRDLNLYILAWTIIGGFFGLCGLLLFRQIPAGQNEIVFMLFGGLAAGFATVLGYFFGSSKGSADKNALLAAKA